MTDEERAREAVQEWWDQCQPRGIALAQASGDLAALSKVIAAVLAAERERCAEVLFPLVDELDTSTQRGAYNRAIADAVAAIRALGESK